jgi:pimeloyl-ACP methyl ester carboxylesterase
MDLYPEIEPYAHGMLGLMGGDLLYWEVCGNPSWPTRGSLPLRRHNAWLGDGNVLRDADKLADIPGVLINGRIDFQAPLTTASELHDRWARSELIVVDNVGHAAHNRAITQNSSGPPTVSRVPDS